MEFRHNPAASALAERYESIQKRMTAATQAAGRNDRVALIAVSKTKSADQVEELYRLGQRDFGENYVQEMAAKAEELKRRGYRDIRWHFIGHLQTNKAKQLLPWTYAIHSVDSEKLAGEISRRWVALGRPELLKIFLEVNIDAETSKAGLDVGMVPSVARAVAQLPGLELQGLMCIPASESGASGEAFRRLKELELSCHPATRGCLSMGMTQDFEIAIREGATHIRVGTALFGQRTPRAH